MNILNTTFQGVGLTDWLIALGIALGTALILIFTKRLIASRLLKLASRTTTDVDDMLAGLVDHISPLFLLVAGLYVGTWWLALPAPSRTLIDHVFFIAALLQAGYWGSRVLAYLIAKSTRLREYEDPSAQTTLNVLGFMSRLMLWSVVLLVILDNLGFDITTLLASLGIGGIAVALAAQGILAELFASLSIAIDKPFVIGDFIVIDSYLGSIEKIGMRTTQIRSLSGELIIFSNTDLLKSRVRNFKRMQERRILFTLDVVYGTSYETVKRIPDLVRSIIETEEMARFDRAHFKSYGPSSLQFEFVYYVLSPDYTEYMDVQQRINLAVYRTFEEEQIEFAFPTHTVHMHAVRGASGRSTEIRTDADATAREHVSDVAIADIEKENPS
ncbi:MAG: mechanosensitive ion channel family protein [Bacteroidetes bacterium]|nr:mechanosensitive ion channel family protein [Bacteroidota bacterium]